MENIGRISGTKAVGREQIQAQRTKMQQLKMEQVASRRSTRAMQEEGFNQVVSRDKFRTLEEQRKKKESLSKAQQLEDDIEVVEETHKIDEAARRFERENNELKAKSLIILRRRLNENDTIEDILKKVLELYPDFTLADEALDFLSQTTTGLLNTKILQAKQYLNNTYEREIKAGKNINLQAQIFSKEGLGTPTALRDMYRDITGNPRTPNTLFDQLSQTFSYEKMKVVIRFLLHSLGSDLKAKGPSISRGELKRLLEDTQSLQAILGVYRFYQARQAMIIAQFDQHGLIMPSILNFELIAKKFMALLGEKYISSEKIIQLSRYLGISEEEIAQIIIFTQMRDSIRNTSPKLYKSERHRQDVLKAILDALEELEDELEEEEEK